MKHYNQAETVTELSKAWICLGVKEAQVRAWPGDELFITNAHFTVVALSFYTRDVRKE